MPGPEAGGRLSPAETAEVAPLSPELQDQCDAITANLTALKQQLESNQINLNKITGKSPYASVLGVYNKDLEAAVRSSPAFTALEDYVLNRNPDRPGEPGARGIAKTYYLELGSSSANPKHLELRIVRPPGLK